jgi:GntR family transcriptional regulator/MocR family aminotransferase
MIQSVYAPLVASGRQGAPVSLRVEQRLRRLVASGLVRPGDRLPPTRELAERLDVNRGALLKAIRSLQAEGILEARVGSGVRVVGTGTGRDSGSPAEAPRFSAALDRLGVGERIEEPPGTVFADLSRLAPDPDSFPTEEFTEILAEACRTESAIWQYASPYGHSALRERIAERLAEAGFPWSASEVLVTSGAQQGLDLIFKAFVDPGDAVAVESPTYPGILPLLRFAGAETVPIPLSEAGHDLSALASRAVRLVYVMPERQNPTGATMDETTRRRILAVARSSGAVAVEDGYETAVSGLAPLSAMDRDRVVAVGSFSKELAPGFRVGWVAAAPQIVRAIAVVKQTSDFQTPLPLQAALAEFLRRGRDREVRARRDAEIEVRGRILRDALGRHLPEAAVRAPGTGGALFWLELPGGVSGRAVERRARERGVRVSAGADFDPAGRDVAAVRLSLSRIARGSVDEAVSRLAAALRDVQARSGTAEAVPTI